MAGHRAKTGMEGKKYPQKIFQKDEGMTFYWWCRFYLYMPLWTLFALSVIWSFLPDEWLASDAIHGIDIWFRANFEKLAAEGATFDGTAPLWGTRYVLFIAICWSLVALTNIVLVGPIVKLTWKFGRPISHDQRNVIWKLSLALAISGYFVFGQWMDLKDPSPGLYAMFPAWIIFPLTAGLAALFHASFAGLVITIIKIVKKSNSLSSS